MAGPTNDDIQDKLLNHTYDGIQEYDNPMPRWWLLTFAATIVFSVIYLFNIGPVGSGKGRIADYEADMAAYAKAHPAPTGGDMSSDQLLALVKDEEAMEEGKEAYTAYCASCHAPDGGGLIGPNLADAYWLHGGTIADIYKTVTIGVLEKGMPPWGKTLKPEQLSAVVAYVSTLQGTTPANPKAPQGTPVTP
ncbi:MAG: cbb3-type cytochrome c oxidase N-terminal domain-containing protein [Gemmatimonas sp.]|jgi:cytochrome c oxidase cbb3-type subunit 3|uniref:cbb3-type cytochrome c oxidase N-terminal domain-containing protein n=1 Tax=Gemmatimonas sp. TaxID=1962908 RepID=UPI0022C56A31|nr:cbb3-type cytochrome c oxidase N-terminal domain-containing protein [Gemmatimonas sp.]MCA2994558.1 c-type cytochrome [Gemmatimonas sp.]MCE2952669.1 c-type cytochrome [Gemmatimonas sp.]MCZ8010902.1 c-type cytochrome [Gemmatimonas sp.]MCZ8266278.1 c-type cytochrome [Gemmatimonas sp.]